MKVMTVLGTRPEIIRLSIVIKKLDKHCNHILVHSGQNYDTRLNEIFFEQMDVRAPDHFLNIRGSLGEQIGELLHKVEALIQQEKPDKFLVLGDTNSALSSIIAKRFAIPVYHMEAGNRCYDDRVPEEVNRRIIDHCSDVLLPYTERSRKNLLREGISGQCIFVTGNPIFEVINAHEAQIKNSTILQELKIIAGEYFLITLHRSENLDMENRLRYFAQAFELLYMKYKVPIIISVHPHTRSRMEKLSIDTGNPHIHYLQPFGLFDFITLERNASVVLSDSGTVQEECCIFKVPTVTLRDVTERPETIECGSNILSGAEVQTILNCVELVLSSSKDWDPPIEYLVENVSDTVTKIVLGYMERGYLASA